MNEIIPLHPVRTKDTDARKFVNESKFLRIKAKELHINPRLYMIPLFPTEVLANNSETAIQVYWCPGTGQFIGDKWRLRGISLLEEEVKDE